MKLGDLYRVAVETGMKADARDRAELQRLMSRAQEEYDRLDESDRDFYDIERIRNPYADTRIALGDPSSDVRCALVGIDMEVGELLLAARLRETGTPIDLILAHHPEGPGLANLHDVMGMQADLWHQHGVGIGLADSLIAPRAEEIRRKIMPSNSYRTIDAARLLGFPVMSCHTPADNCVNAFVQDFLDEQRPETLDGVVKALRTIPEYGDAAKKGYGPALVQGRGSGRPGKMVADMTGGTEGPIDALDKLAASGVDTLVGMHYSEEHRARAESLHLNLVIAGHVSSDSLGMNLVLDAIQAEGELEVVTTSGMIRVDRRR